MRIFFLSIIIKKKKMKFSIETEVNESLSFLDVKIFRENEKFVTSVFRKETFSRVYTNSISFIPLDYKFGLVQTLLNRCFNFSPDFLKFNHQVDKLNLTNFCRKMHTHKSLLIVHSKIS